jgi:hypothetical protein
VAERYEVVEGSESGHCCFEASVVDTTKPLRGKGFEVMCECFEKENAELIARALNLMDTSGAREASIMTH